MPTPDEIQHQRTAALLDGYRHLFGSRDHDPVTDPIRAAANDLGEPISMADYQTWREHQNPRPLSAWTLMRRAGGWPAACNAAGVRAKGHTYRRWTRDDHLTAVRTATADLGEPLTSSRYRAWRATRTEPTPDLTGYSGPEWAELVRQAGAPRSLPTSIVLPSTGTHHP